jgi:serine phosphatase RsbU (regulator of sigma subunit)
VFLYDFKTGIVKDDFIDRTINERFKVVIIYAAAKIPGDIYAIGTTTDEGILFFDKNGRLLSRLNKGSSDLEDNTILALYCDPDKNSELWISTNGIISKAYTNLPLTKFDSKQGIDNAVNEICKFGGNIYLSTDAGILRTYTEDNTFRFRKLPGTDSQFFPLSVFKSSRGDFLLAGYLDGIIQVSRNDVISEVEKNCLEFPRMSLNTKSILQSSRDPDIVYIGDEVKGVIILRYEGDHWRFLNRIKIPSGSLSEIAEQGENNLWVMTDDPNGIYRIDISSNKLNITGYGRDKGVDEIELFSMDIINGDLYISTGSGILKYNKTDDNFAPDRELTAGAPGIENVQNLFIDEDGDLILSGFNSRYSDMLFSKSETGTRTYRGVFNLLPNVPTLDLLSSEGRYFLTKSKIVAVLGKDRLVQDTTRVSPRFVSITVGSDSIVMDGMFHSDIDGKRRLPQLKAVSSSVPEYSYDMNRIAFEWTTSHFIEEGQTEYSYKLEGYDREWSRWEGISFGFTAEGLYSKKEYTNLPYGHYIFKVRNRTLTGLTGDELTFEFIILKPWYSTILAFIMFSLIGILIIILIISTYTKRLKRENIRLEGIVTERTAVVVKQKEELESSIHYASRIQMALLPSEKILSENIRNYFVLFKPRDIVSGDFYWMTKKGDRLYIVAADCTGHGVPGAFMSLLGMSFLDEIIDKDVSRRADAILNELRLHVTESLKQVGEDDETKDGMDIALLVIDFGTQRVEFSGAYNPCFRVRKLSADEMRDYQQNLTELPDGSMSDGKYLLETIYASKMPIGISSKMNEKFDFHDWSLEKGISYYLFSDGYIDQFGGKNGRKFMKKNFKKLILQVQDFPMSKQKNILENTLREWMGNSPQIDDILVMGIRTE